MTITVTVKMNKTVPAMETEIVIGLNHQTVYNFCIR